MVEIGAADGGHSVRIARWCRQNQAKLEVIDPLPDFDVDAFEASSQGHATVHRALSLQVLAGLLPADVVLIDGDHNWYTVFHELGTMFGADGPLPDHAPIVVCHDVGWPYGRRDLYYAPETIPEAYRQPHRKGPLRPEIAGLAESGLNPEGWHAEREGGPRNGVRTAIQDALAGRTDQVRIVWLDVLFGLAVISPLHRLEASPALAQVLDDLELSRNWKSIARMVEQERIGAAVGASRLAALTGFAPVSPSGARPFTTDVPQRLLATIQHGLQGFSYKNRSMVLSPFDMANLQALIEQLRPRTIFEIGVFEGGRSLWMADAMRAHAIEGRVIGVDLTPPADLDDPLIEIRAGDATNLAAVFDQRWLETLPRPFLVIEDSAHTLEVSAAVLDFFDPHLRTGDYVIVEDGNMDSLMGDQSATGLSGPSAAIDRFLARRGEAYEVDVEACDRFGFNVTSNPNGWLKRR